MSHFGKILSDSSLVPSGNLSNANTIRAINDQLTSKNARMENNSPRFRVTISPDWSQDGSSEDEDCIDVNYLVERPSVTDQNGNVYEGQWYN